MKCCEWVVFIQAADREPRKRYRGLLIDKASWGQHAPLLVHFVLKSSSVTITVWRNCFEAELNN